MKFGDLLNSYIKILGCSAKELADRSGISPALISRYRSGKRTPQAGSLQIGMLAGSVFPLVLVLALALLRRHRRS
jgi:transcriptional regulator with XRE-family HTH domain